MSDVVARAGKAAPDARSLMVLRAFWLRDLRDQLAGERSVACWTVPQQAVFPMRLHVRHRRSNRRLDVRCWRTKAGAWVFGRGADEVLGSVDEIGQVAKRITELVGDQDHDAERHR